MNSTLPISGEPDLLSRPSSFDLDSVPTPALVLKSAVILDNLQRLSHYSQEQSIGIRPHTKTHKLPLLAHLQKKFGAIGLTMAKVGEIEKLAEDQGDILLAYPALDLARTERLAQLSHRVTLRVAVDSKEAVIALSKAASKWGSQIGILVDLDVGMHRTGVPTPQDALELAQFVQDQAQVRLDGIFCYPGHVWSPVEQQLPILNQIGQQLEEALDLFHQRGLSTSIVSGGSTPTAYQSHLIPAYTEIRPGTYIFNDMNTVRGGYCAIENCAAHVICTVVSTAVKDQVVLDGGSKTFAMDRCIPAQDQGHGYLVDYPDAKITALSEEHAQVDISRCERKPALGERVAVIPNHICPCVNLQNHAWWFEEGHTLRQLHVTARGELS